MKTFEEFAHNIRLRESSDKYDAENSLGYLGAYQFGMARLSDFKLTRLRDISFAGSMKNDDYEFYGIVSKEDFLAAPKLQDFIFTLHIKEHKKRIESKLGDLTKYKYLNVELDLSGCLAVCHLLGFGGILHLINGINDKDAYGTEASEYLQTFAGYEINLT